MGSIKIEDSKTLIQVAIVMLLRGTKEQKKEAFSYLIDKGVIK